MALVISHATLGLIETLLEVSHDPDAQDFYDVDEYIDNLPNTAKVLRELAHYFHAEYL